MLLIYITPIQVKFGAAHMNNKFPSNKEVTLSHWKWQVCSSRLGYRSAVCLIYKRPRVSRQLPIGRKISGLAHM